MIQNRWFKNLALLSGIALLWSVGCEAIMEESPLKRGLSWGVWIAVMNAAICSSVLFWASQKEDRVFYSAFFGGMFWKLMILAVTFFVVVKNQSVIHPIAAMTSLAVGTFFLNLIEGFFLTHIHGLQRNS